MVDLNYNAPDEELERNYLLDKTIIDIYNFSETKESVLDYIKEYKVARAKSFKALAFECISSSKFENEKVFSTKLSREGKFENKVDDILDSTNFVSIFDKIAEKMKETFTKVEKNYYELCLLSNYSEEYCRMNFSGGLSINGFTPIKKSCILKIALAFGLEVLKWLVNNLYIVC